MNKTIKEKIKKNYLSPEILIVEFGENIVTSSGIETGKQGIILGDDSNENNGLLS